MIWLISLKLVFVSFIQITFVFSGETSHISPLFFFLFIFLDILQMFDVYFGRWQFLVAHFRRGSTNKVNVEPCEVFVWDTIYFHELELHHEDDLAILWLFVIPY